MKSTPPCIARWQRSRECARPGRLDERPDAQRLIVTLWIIVKFITQQTPLRNSYNRTKC